MLEKSELVPVVESAFLPLMCVAELKNYEHAFGFAVYLPNGGRVVYEEKNASRLRDSNALQQALRVVRRRVASKGIKLAPWSMPVHP